MVERYRPPPRVGYGRPPEHTRFQRGKSGNPKGRPRSKITPSGKMEKELSSEICIIENGQRQKLTKLHVVFRRAINSAMTKGPKDLILLMQKLDLIEKFSPKEILTKFADVDLDKLSLDEKLKMMKELIAESKPLDEYT